MSAEHDIDGLIRDTFFKNGTVGTLVEVGAALPDYLSISESFRRLGWNVIAVEPNPEFCKAHRERGYDILEYACSDADADDVDFYVVDSFNVDYMGGRVSYESFSSLGSKDKYAELQETIKTSTKKIKVKMRKLDTILADYAPNLTTIDVVAVDVEGWELSVVAGLNISKYNPKVIVLENLFCDQAYVDHMKVLGFYLWKRFEPNDIYVRSDLAPSLSDKSLLDETLSPSQKASY